MNGENGLPFFLLRSIQQDYPLSLYLFILTIDVLGYVLSNPCYGVRGLKLLNGGIFQYQSFVNDTILYLECLAKNLERACGVFFCFILMQVKKLTGKNHQPFEHLLARGILIGVEKKGYVGFLRDKE